MITAAIAVKLPQGTENPRIYINPQLTPFYSRLAYLGRTAVANERIHASFVTQFGFFVKLTESSQPVAIINESQLNEFIAQTPKPRAKTVIVLSMMNREWTKAHRLSRVQLK